MRLDQPATPAGGGDPSRPPEGTGARGPETAVLLVNLGTPDEPTPAAVRCYLREFLGDPRVVEIPRAIWLPILHGVILRTRPAQSARRYASIWTGDGSPLASWTRKQATLLRGYLGERGHLAEVRYAMRYGAPSIASVLDELTQAGARRILVVPLYPQYAGATTGSAFDALAVWGQRTRALPELRFVAHYHDDANYVAALRARVADFWMSHGRPDRLVMSFHGLPKRSVDRGDPYRRQCEATARLLAQSLGLREEQWLLAFQSRFGRARWLEPYTLPALVDLARRGERCVHVVCPGFSADCLETLEEIAQEARGAFLEAGGREFQYIPALNDSHPWIDALAALAIRHLQGWPTATPRPAPR